MCKSCAGSQHHLLLLAEMVSRLTAEEKRSIEAFARHMTSEDSEDSYDSSDGASSDGYSSVKEEKQDLGSYIAMKRQPLELYHRLEHRKYHNYPDSYKLFRIFYSLWKQTGLKEIHLGQLGAIIRAEDPAMLTNKAGLKVLLQMAKKRKFPIQFIDEHRVDFEPLVDAIKAKESVDGLSAAMHGDWF